VESLLCRRHVVALVLRHLQVLLALEETIQCVFTTKDSSLQIQRDLVVCGTDCTDFNAISLFAVQSVQTVPQTTRSRWSCNEPTLFVKKIHCIVSSNAN